METKTIHMKNEQDTREFGLKIGARVQPGTVIAMIGDLGTGKTTLTKAIAEGMGVTETITSPTFNIVKEYETCLLYTSPSPRDRTRSRMPSSA